MPKAEKTPVLSVIISTYNREEYLHLSLNSLVGQTLAKQAFEIIVVNNNSTDGTAQIVKSYAQKLPQMRCVFEAKQGISHARNRGAAESKAANIVFLDDDAEAPPEWAVNLVQAFADYPDAAALGGPIEPNWEGPEPEWLPAAFKSFYTWLDYGNQVLNLTEKGGVLLGANIAFNKAKFMAYGQFNTQLGRVGKNLISGEETRLIEGLKEQGEAIYYLPHCGVRHLVLPERRSKKFLKERMVADGRSQIIIGLEKQGSAPEFLKRKLRYEQKKWLQEKALAILAVFKGTCQHMAAQCLVARRLGRIAQLKEQLRKA
jgi:glycosyltransferase involved in cell wall biosynthesis